ncbi:hypothetical protein PC129_g17254 [Phytophthora cactorum]|uniref:Uncharacterized protein n=1 Tax=Phytophthora cactorum TaxID=29920 RepID=A0A329RBU2_9STRA|nr:hypothetical protein Pcac1_g645 [Phytophthora cactorum]KAG2806057.1 hypothetical protein PC111_g17547 [Phytophthora cactorum]KAG2809514.1 hypothetical protein PC112_g16469 [Phytophthora cactorum]KAG2850716.1 hypothetical protein PC113_g16529 [Phytophthora cactorum]KAG2889167.1 hypothetical protein PC114_g18084 [Phytophthora cactorum]
MAQRRQAIDIGRKQEVIAWIEAEGDGKPTRAIAHFRTKGWSLDGGTVRKWWRLKDKIKDTPSHQLRFAGGGRKKTSESLEEMLYDEFMNKRLKNEKVTRTWLSNTALAIYAEEVGENGGLFAASDHCVTDFMKRYGISPRRHTNLTTLDDATLVGHTVSYLKYLNELKPSINLERTVLMDETAVYFEDAWPQTLDCTGARHIVVRSTGFACMRITVVLAVSATGRKLPPLLVWKGKNTPALEKRPGPLYVVQQPRAWVGSELLKKWLDMAFPLVDSSDGKCLVTSEYLQGCQS